MMRCFLLPFFGLVLFLPSTAFGQLQEDSPSPIFSDSTANLDRKMLLKSRNRSMAEILSILQNHDESGESILNSLVLTEEQTAEVEKIKSRYFEEILEFESKVDDPRQRSIKRSRLTSNVVEQLREVLLPHQILMLRELDILRVGPFKVATNSMLDKSLGLSDKQKQSIQEKSDQLAKEIFDFVHSKRQEAFDILQKELSTEQLSKFDEMFDMNRTKKQLSATPIDLLYSHLVFNQPKEQDTKYDPILYLKRTDLERKKE